MSISHETAADASTQHDHDRDYAALLTSVGRIFESRTRDAPALFCTSTDGLFDTFLASLPGEQQVHTCRTCRRFFDTFGALVTVESDGSLQPVLWAPSAVPAFYGPAVAALNTLVRSRPVSGVFFSADQTWGTPVTGPWVHMAVRPPTHLIYRQRLKTAGQARAGKAHDMETMRRAMAEYDVRTLTDALRVLEAEALARSERFVGPVRWLLDLKTRMEKAKGRQRDNVLWAAVGTAPEGYCHPRAGVVGELLDDIRAGMDFETVKRRFNSKLNPLVYQRPQAAPTAGNIKEAERIVATLGIEPSLHRRFARLDDCVTIWKPAAPQPAAPTGGVFGHIKPKKGAQAARAPMALPPMPMTWEKFARVVLPSAEAMELMVPHHGPFIALVTAEHADAPPILKWDREDERNPVSWYCYPNGSVATGWNLRGGQWTKVNGIVPLPPLWGSQPKPHLGEGMVFVLDGARDTVTGQGNALFPEMLQDSLRPVRATIETFSKGAAFGGREAASACGYDWRKRSAGQREAPVSLRVRTGDVWTSYTLDRWD